jgi:tetratricopeptide (TPR) repeat protein
MKNLSLLFFILSPIFCNAQNAYTDSEGDQHLLGKITISDLETEPFKEWFTREIDEDYSLECSDKLADLKVKIFIGTWCGDSRKWLPEFITLWKDNNLPFENLSLIALHNEDDQYKQSPSGEEKGLNIHRVPTFIFYNDEQEVARIVESPVNDLKTDITQIAHSFPSKPRYKAVSILDEAMRTQTLDTLYSRKNYRSLLQEVYAEVSKPSELNTYGYVLKASGNLEKAAFVFYVNRNLFQWNPNTWDSLGEIYFEQEKFVEAKFNYEKVIELNPKSANAKEMLEKIKDKI